MIWPVPGGLIDRTARRREWRWVPKCQPKAKRAAAFSSGSVSVVLFVIEARTNSCMRRTVTARIVARRRVRRSSGRRAGTRRPTLQRGPSVRRGLLRRRWACLEHAVDPGLDRGGDFFPALGGHHQVRPPLELDLVGSRRRRSYFSYCSRKSDAGTVWSLSAPTIRSGARSAFWKWTSLGGSRWKLASPAGGTNPWTQADDLGLPRDRAILEAGFPSRADVAQLVEHFTRNEGVPGSSPGVGFTVSSHFRAFPESLPVGASSRVSRRHPRPPESHPGGRRFESG